MKVLTRRAVLSTAATAALCLASVGAVRSQSMNPGTSQKPQMSEDAFKNIQVLRGIPVNQFMDTMGFFAASLGMNCTDCHIKESAGSWARYADDTPLKQTARRMVVMMRVINQGDFEGPRKVTCYTCHRGVQIPEVTPSLAEQYGTPPPPDPDLLQPIPDAAPDPAAAEKIVDKFVAAIGGTDKLSKLSSFVAKGTYSGFDTEFQKSPVEIDAKAPDQWTMSVHVEAGNNVTTFDGSEAWVAATNKPLPLIMLDGGELDGARLDAELSFPATLKQDLSNWRVGFPPASIGGHPVQVVEGTAPGGSKVMLFFDKESGLLVRQARLIDTAVGVTPMHVDYSDYRLVAGSGTKMPFKREITWVDGQSTIELTGVQPNVAVPAGKFAKPAMSASR